MIGRLFAALLALCPALALAVGAAGPCLPPGVTAWHCSFNAPGDNRATVAAAAEACRAYRQSVSGITTTITSVTWVGGSSGYSVIGTNGLNTNVSPVGTFPTSDPLAYARAPFQCTSTPAEAACATTALARVQFQYSGTNTTDPIACKNSCQLAPFGTGGVGTSQGAGVNLATGVWRFDGIVAPTGATCTTDDSTLVYVAGAEAEKEQCAPHGSNLSTCYNAATRQICTVTPRGNKACWTPSESSTKVSPDQTESLAKATAPTIPTAPTGLVNAEVSQARDIQVTNNTSAPTTTIYNIQYANQRGVAGTGTDTSGDGEGGTCDGSGDCTNAGNAAGVVTAGGIYDGDVSGGATTFNGAWDSFKADVSDSALVNAGEQFFTVTVSGTCPQIDFGENDWWGTLDSDVLCSGELAALFEFMGWFLVSLAAMTAFKWAFMY